MRKIIMFNMVSLDGLFEGPDGNIDWHMVDEEFNTFSVDQLNTAGGLIFGRRTYELMASYWPTPAAAESDPEVAEKMNTLPKYVVTRTLNNVSWANSYLIKGDAAGELQKLKRMPGNDLFLFGSAELASTLIRQNMIDEYRIIVNPVILGQGRPLFSNIPDMVALRLCSTRTFGNGNTLLIYQPDQTQPVG